MDEERLAVVADGFVRLYRMNGSGLLEYATIRADLTAEDAARLVASLGAFLAETDRNQRFPGREPITIKPKALAEPGQREQPASSHGSVRGPIQAYLGTNPGSRSPEIATALGLNKRQVQSCLSAHRFTAFRRDPNLRWFNVGTVDKPKRSASGTRNMSRTRTDHEAADAAILAYVAEHPGTLIQEMREALGLERMYVANRLMNLYEKRIRRERDPNYPNSKRLWLIEGG